MYLKNTKKKCLNRGVAKRDPYPKAVFLQNLGFMNWFLSLNYQLLLGRLGIFTGTPIHQKIWSVQTI